MVSHDEYGKRVMRAAAGPAWRDSGPSLQVDYGTRHPARIDGTVGTRVAVEIESRVSKGPRNNNVYK